jgi:hypothetical protein
LNKIWAQDKVYIFIGTLLGTGTEEPNYKQHTLSPAEVRKVCYSVAQLYIKSVYLKLFEWRGQEFHGTLPRGVQGIKVWEHLEYTDQYLLCYYVQKAKKLQKGLLLIFCSVLGFIKGKQIIFQQCW